MVLGITKLTFLLFFLQILVNILVWLINTATIKSSIYSQLDLSIILLLSISIIS